MLEKRFWLLLFVLLCGAPKLHSQIFTWKNKNLPKDSLKKDSILAAKISREIFVRDTADFIRTGNNSIVIEEAALARTDRSKLLGDLNASGSIIRGVTFGNNQGSSAQSSMDLQISGKLSKDVSLLASISDHNLPIQADGYTQTWEEFDKVYLQLNIKNNTLLRAGHLDLTDDKTYFGRYQRRSMGLEFDTVFGEENLTKFNLSAGIARSEFHRTRFQGIEGNQGPYRLTGKNGENFITIISGSEQVFMDGLLLKRGENLDYVINYNTGELTFTSFRPVYRQNFITVSYNYTNRNYNRYLVTGGITHKRKQLSFGVNWFLENDNKNAPLALNLSKEDEQVLAAAGNDVALMYAPSGEPAEYDVNKILYEKKQGAAGFYYEFSTDQAAQLYQVSFTWFGAGLGDYRLKQSTNNGRVFEYVGAGMGDYAAVRRLPAPEKSQVISGNVAYSFTGGKAGADFSLSNYDRNLFSSKDNSGNTGFASRIFADKIFSKNNWKAVSAAEYQHINRRFHILDRINNVEFARDFNLAQEFSGRTQDRFTFSFLNSWQNLSFINYRINFLNEKNFYKGLKNDLDFGWLKGRFATKGAVSYLDTESDFQNTNFTRGNIISEYLGKKGSWGIGAAMEHNVKKIKTEDIFDGTSYSWKEVFAQKKIGDSARTKLFTKIYFRDNDSVRENRLQNMNHILGFMTESQIIKTEKSQLSALLHYRKFFYKNNFENASENQDFVIGNIVYNQQLFRNGVRLQAFYELGNGQEAQREFQYIKVADGQGIYKWTDYNGDGVQQTEEFEVAEYADLAQYIRIYTNAVRYLPSNKNKLQLAIFMNPSAIFNSQNTFLKRWNFNVSLLSQNSFLKGQRVLVWNPFEKHENQILKNQNFLASAQFNPTDKSGWNGSYRYTATDNLINANFSDEENIRKSHVLILGYWFSRDFRVDWENSYETARALSELFASRNYQLENMETKPRATYKLTDALQAELFGAFRNRLNINGDERLKAWEATGTMQWERKKTSLRASFSFINNDFSGNSFSIVGNQMLEGLKAGKNQVWSLYLQQALNSFVNLNLNYDGRNSGERTIHTGSVQLRANF